MFFECVWFEGGRESVLLQGCLSFDVLQFFLCLQRIYIVICEVNKVDVSYIFCKYFLQLGFDCD